MKAWQAGRSAVSLGPLGQSEDGEGGQEGEQEGESPHGARSLYSAVQCSPARGAVVPGAGLCSTQHPAVHCARRPVRPTFILAAVTATQPEDGAAPADNTFLTKPGSASLSLPIIMPVFTISSSKSGIFQRYSHYKTNPYSLNGISVLSESSQFPPFIL